MAAESADQLRQLMPPPPPRPPRLQAVHLPGDSGLPKAVLPEDDYSDAVAAIIERDYFPDIPKLRNQLEWAQATKSGDPEAIRQAQVNIARRRAGLATPKVASGASTPSAQTPGFSRPAATPLGWEATPAAAPLHTPAMTPLGAATATTSSGLAAPGATPLLHTGPGHNHSGAPIAAPVEQLRAPPMSLDTFLATHTSEDNASFAKIHTKDLVRKRQKIVHYLKDNNKPLLLEGPKANPQDGYGTGGQEPFTLVPTKHNPTNALYYVPSQKPLSAAETDEQASRAPKAINIRATRLKATEDLAAANAAAAAVAAATGAAPAAAGAAACDDYSRLATPAFTPGAAGMSPLMTWGDLASTPLRLEGEDAIAFDPSALLGPRFEVPSQPKREQVGHELAAAKSLGELKRRQKEAQQAAALPAGVGGALSGALTPRAHTGQRVTPARPWSGAGTPGLGGGLSAAAQRLAKQLTEKRARMGSAARTPTGDGADRMLRATYKGATAAATPTPGRAVSGLAVGQKRSAASAQHGAVDSKTGLTDDLLHL